MIQYDFIFSHLILVVCPYVYDWLVGWVLWHINLCRLFYPESIFMLKSVLFQTIQLSMSTQFNCQRHFYSKLFSLFKQF